MSRYVYPFTFKLIVLILFTNITISIFPDETRKVRQGETVYQLSREYGIPVEVLLEVNHIRDPSDIPTGQELTIPTQATVNYTVKKGDTLYSIAHKFGISLYEIRNYNRGISDNILVGQKVLIPDNTFVRTNANVNNSSDTRASQSTSTLADTKKSTQSLQNFGEAVSSNLFEDSKYMGTVSQKIWPLSGNAYLLDGKLPGVLIKANRGDIVLASKGGIVVYASLHTSFNNVVVVQGNDNIVYVYAGQETLFVKQGDTIKKGSKIGKLGVMPTVQEAMLYFSAWNKDKFQDPRTLVANNN